MRNRAYYNDNNPFCCEWLRNLIKAGLIADGVVDERPIQEVSANDLKGFTQIHLFAGIAAWSYALRLAGWPDDRPVMTLSCPCQPFSCAGKRKGVSDERHLWPEAFRLIRECRPSVVLGEQVSAAIRGGWLDSVLSDLERAGYACGAAVLPACGVGAPHRRERLWFVAESRRESARRGLRRPEEGIAPDCSEASGQPERPSGVDFVADSEDSNRRRATREAHERRRATQTGGSGGTIVVADTGQEQWRRRKSQQQPVGANTAKRRQKATDNQRSGTTDIVADAEGCNRKISIQQRQSLKASTELEWRSRVGGMADAEGIGSKQRPTHVAGCNNGGDAKQGTKSIGNCSIIMGNAERGGREGNARRRAVYIPANSILLGDSGGEGLSLRPGAEDRRGTIRKEGATVAAPGSTNGFWADAEWLPCQDGKVRPTGRGISPLVQRMADADVCAGQPGKPQSIQRTVSETDSSGSRQGTIKSRIGTLVDGPTKGVVRGSDSGAPFNPDATAEARVMRLRGYGNAIVVPLAAEFIRAYMKSS